MKAFSKYVQLLEKQLALAEKQLSAARQDVEFYRGKCERLELAIMSNPPAQQAFAARQEKPAIDKVRVPQPPPRIPFSDLKTRWNSLSQDEQEKALKDGWDIETEKQQEATNAGQ